MATDAVLFRPARLPDNSGASNERAFLASVTPVNRMVGWTMPGPIEAVRTPAVGGGAGNCERRFQETRAARVASPKTRASNARERYGRLGAAARAPGGEAVGAGLVTVGIGTDDYRAMTFSMTLKSAKTPKAAAVVAPRRLTAHRR